MGVPVGRFWYGSRKCEGSGERKSVCGGGGGGLQSLTSISTTPVSLH